MITTYKQALDYLDSFISPIPFDKVRIDRYEKKDPLDRMRKLLTLLDNPQKKFKSVLIGGTSGKGSTSYLISRMLTTAGYKTGYTLSPHLEKINERIQLNDQEISDDEFVHLLNEVSPAVEKMKQSEVEVPSHFEILIAMAFLYFAKQQVDIAIVEVGLGGEFDATNTLEPLVSVLTNVSLDHTAILGNTVEKIAKTKAGIIKNYELGKPVVVTGVSQPSVIKIVEEKCRETGAKLYRLGKESKYKIKEEAENGIVFDFYSSNEEAFDLTQIELSLLGDFQVENAALAIETVVQLKQFGFSINEEQIRKALKSAFVPGRMELRKFIIHNSKFRILLDGAHNPAKMDAFVNSLNKIFPDKRKIFVVSFKEDKDISDMLTIILNCADALILTQFNAQTYVSRQGAMDVSSIKNTVLSIKKNDVQIIMEKEPEKALKKAIELTDQDSIIIVTGSLYFVGEVRQLLTANN
jgi:dihydrofolate synthase/folylpolyglutamate synthase